MKKELLFKKKDWKAFPDQDLREKYLNAFDNYSSKFREQQPAKLPAVVPMMCGIQEEAIWEVFENGFAKIPMNSQGYFGNGHYFTQDVKLASESSTKTVHGRPILIALTVPGNSFPVTESAFKMTENIAPSPTTTTSSAPTTPNITDSIPNPNPITSSSSSNFTSPSNMIVVPNEAGYLGKVVRAGYQSHLSYVSRDNISVPVKVRAETNLKDYVTQLVLFQYAQIVPLFVIYLDI